MTLHLWKCPLQSCPLFASDHVLRVALYYMLVLSLLYYRMGLRRNSLSKKKSLVEDRDKFQTLIFQNLIWKKKVKPHNFSWSCMRTFEFSYEKSYFSREIITVLQIFNYWDFKTFFKKPLAFMTKMLWYHSPEQVGNPYLSQCRTSIWR